MPDGYEWTLFWGALSLITLAVAAFSNQWRSALLLFGLVGVVALLQAPGLNMDLAKIALVDLAFMAGLIFWARDDFLALLFSLRVFVHVVSLLGIVPIGLHHELVNGTFGVCLLIICWRSWPLLRRRRLYG